MMNDSKRYKQETHPQPLRGGEKERYISTPVYIGNVPLGGSYPVRIQSMTNTDTLDTKASVAQCIRIIEAGADYVRLTAQGIKEAENLANIKREIRKAGFMTPLIADIHFNPAAAEKAAALVEKVRINPGNYADKRASFLRRDLSEKEYNEELERIHERLLPLINICRENGTVIRIGINHGSLSDRIMTRYGNTAEGMVQSALEFIRIFRAGNFNNLVMSMKSSDTAVVLEANRKMIKMMKAEGVSYPIHLGVTEAGEGEDGRVRSAAGIGALLSEGIGDTIRVSLSEDPEFEIPVAREILLAMCSSSGRIKKPAEAYDFKAGGIHYRPEVFSSGKNTFYDETGNPFTGNVIKLKPGVFPGLPDLNEDPAILNPVLDENNPVTLAIKAAVLAGRYFILRLARGICITNRGSVKEEKLKEISFSILQATEARITRNRYISCPTCGRTRFSLQERVKEVKAATAHFTGLKIAVMGCIVNGPGEMAGADYGYVGAAEGKVHIYRGTNPVMKNVPEAQAIDVLLKIIVEDTREI